MAETIGLIGSLISIAGAGLTLAQKLHDYGAGVASSGKRTQEIAFHVRSTATVVQEVAKIFKEEGSARQNLVSQKAIETVEDVVKQCSAQFDQLNLVLDNTANGGGLGKLLFPLRESRLVLLQSNLERLKMTLQCFMQVIIYARLKAEENGDDQSQRTLIQELILLRKQAAATYERNKIKAQEEDEREPSGPSLPNNCITIPSELHLSAAGTTTECLDEEDKEAPASIAANAKAPICNYPLDAAAVSGESKTILRRHQRSIGPEQIDNTADSGGSQTEDRVRSESLPTSLEDHNHPTIATEPAQDQARVGQNTESPELARAWDGLVYAIDQLVHALAVTCCCCCAKRKSEDWKIAVHCADAPADRLTFHIDPMGTSPRPQFGASGSIHRRADQKKDCVWSNVDNVKVVLQGDLTNSILLDLEGRASPKPRSAASGSVHLGALPSQEEPMYVVAPYEVDELLDLWTNLNQEPSSTHD